MVPEGFTSLAPSAGLVPKVAEGSDTDRNLKSNKNQSEIILLTSVHVRILLRNPRTQRKSKLKSGNFVRQTGPLEMECTCAHAHAPSALIFYCECAALDRFVLRQIVCFTSPKHYLFRQFWRNGDRFAPL